MIHRSTVRCSGRWLAVVLLLTLGVPAAAERYHRYRGAIHIHTVYSDGSGTFAEVAAAAQAVGLDYLIVTDHNTLGPICDGHQRYWGKTLVLIGTEISTDAGHCLALDVPGSFEWGTREPRTVIDRVRAAGGFTILAHPMSPRWRWRDWSVRGYSGIEIINLSSVIDDDLRDAAHGLRIEDRSVRRLLELAQRYVIAPDRVMDNLPDLRGHAGAAAGRVRARSPADLRRLPEWSRLHGLPARRGRA